MALHPCVVDACDGLAGKPGTARGMCAGHYQRWRKYGDPLVTKRRRNVCAVEDCTGFVLAHGWCTKHHTRWLRHGSPTHRLPGEIVGDSRVCPQCHEDKPLGEWGKHRGTKTGYAAYCKKCTADRQRNNRARAEYVRSPRDPIKDRAYTRRWRLANPEKVRGYAAARRAARAAATVETFSVLEIFERDGWTCHICKTPIDPGLRYPNTLSASLDHVTPLARGGEHSRANCAAAHLFCNLSKKDRVGV